MQKFKFLSKDKEGKAGGSGGNSNEGNLHSNNSNHHSAHSNKKKRNKHGDVLHAEDTLSMLSEQRRLISRNAIVSSSGKVNSVLASHNFYDNFPFLPRTSSITTANGQRFQFGMLSTNWTRIFYRQTIMIEAQVRWAVRAIRRTFVLFDQRSVSDGNP